MIIKNLQGPLVRGISLVLHIVVAFALLLCIVGGGRGASAQNSKDLAVQSAIHDSKIGAIENTLRRIEDSRVTERIVRIENQLEWLEYGTKAVLAALGVLIMDRIRELLISRKAGAST